MGSAGVPQVPGAREGRVEADGTVVFGPFWVGHVETEDSVGHPLVVPIAFVFVGVFACVAAGSIVGQIPRPWISPLVAGLLPAPLVVLGVVLFISEALTRWTILVRPGSGVLEMLRRSPFGERRWVVGPEVEAPLQISAMLARGGRTTGERAFEVVVGGETRISLCTTTHYPDAKRFASALAELLGRSLPAGK